jgi:hypothetical protein
MPAEVFRDVAQFSDPRFRQAKRYYVHGVIVPELNYEYQTIVR